MTDIYYNNRKVKKMEILPLGDKFISFKLEFEYAETVFLSYLELKR